MSHEAHDKRQKRPKVIEERGKEPDNGGVTLLDLGFKCSSEHMNLRGYYT